MTASPFAAIAAQALDATYAHYGVSATWTTAEAAPLPGVRVIKTAPTDDVRFGESQARVDRVMVRVRRSEVAAALEGDLVAIGTDTFRVLADPGADDFGLEWICEAAPVRSRY